MGSGLAIGDGVIYVAFMRDDIELRMTRSLDAGATWSRARTLGTPIAYDSLLDDGLALAVDGRRAAVAFPVWSRSGTHLFVRHTDDAGATWSAPSNVSSVNRKQIINPRLTWQGGTLRVGFTRCARDCTFPVDLRLLYRASADGDNWTPTQKVADYLMPTAIGFAGQILLLVGDRPTVYRGSAH
jgi:hypothetical protein